MRTEVFQTSIANILKKENTMGMFGSDIPQLLHITEKDYSSLQGPVLQHLSLVVRNLKQLFTNLIVKFWDDNAFNALFQKAPTGFTE